MYLVPTTSSLYKNMNSTILMIVQCKCEHNKIAATVQVLVPTVIAIVIDENLRENRQCFSKRPVLLMNFIVSSIIPWFTITLRSTRPQRSNLHNPFEERYITSIPVRLEPGQVELYIERRSEGSAGINVHYLLCQDSTDLARTGWIRAVKIPVTA